MARPLLGNARVRRRDKRRRVTIHMTEGPRGPERRGHRMDNVDLQVLRQVSQWCGDGRRVVLGTITRTWGSAPRPPGSVVAIRDDGMVTGSVSGGCIEDDLID